MSRICVISDAANITKPDCFEVGPDVLISDWLLSHYGPDGPPVPIELFLGGLSEQNHIGTDYKSVNQPLHNRDLFVISNPLGIDPVTIFIAVVIAIATVVLLPTPNLSNLDGPGQQKRSPNNALVGATNIARTLERIPDIFGLIKSFPDLIAPTVAEFIDHIKFQTEYMCVGRGFYDLEDFKTGETLIEVIEGSSLEIFPPNAVPTTVLKTRQSNEVASQLLDGQVGGQQQNLSSSYTVTYDLTPDEAHIFSASTEFPDGFITGTDVTLVDFFADPGAGELDLTGTYEIADRVSDIELVLKDAATIAGNWTSFNGTPQNVIDAGHSPVLVGQDVAALVIGPFVVPGSDNFEIWIDLQAPKGLAQGEKLNLSHTVDLEFTFEEIDSQDEPAGPSFVYPIELTDSSRDPRFYTFKVGVADGLNVTKRYRVSGTRLTETNPDSLEVLDDIRWTRLAGIEDVAAPDTSGTTRVVVKTQATEQVAAIQERKFNVQATRKVVTWNGTAVVGNIETGIGLLASRRMADIFLHYFLDTKLAARSISDLDVVTLFEIQDALDLVFFGQKGEFSYTFDNKNTPAIEELRQIAQAARCFVFREGSVFSLTRDEEQPVSTTLFTRKNKTADVETKTIRFNRPLDKDGVQIEYRDIDDDQMRTIVFPDDLPPTDENFGLPVTLSTIEIDGIGIRQYTQAWDRAQYEFRRLINRRRRVEFTATREAIVIPLNARVDNMDDTLLGAPASDGELRAIDDLAITTSERCIFDLGKTYSVVFRNETGDALSSAIAVTERAGTIFGFDLSETPSITLHARGDDSAQRGTLYSFFEDGENIKQAYLIERKTPEANGNVRLTLVNYSAADYGADDVQPPNKS